VTNFTLNRSKRKTVAIHISDGLVEVRAPNKMPLFEINRFVLSKEKWISDKLAGLSELTEKRSRFTLTYGDRISYRGKPYPITQRYGNRIGFDETGFYMPPNLTAEQIKHACVQIYRMLARRDLTKKTLDYAKSIRVMPDAIKINSAKTRWGSCSAKKSVNYSWRLILADDDVIDYIVVHELAHLVELNHSESFWAIVEGIMPDYKARKARLREFQKKLSVESWD